MQTTKKRSAWKILFVSPNEPRLRAGWRLAIQSVGLVILIVCFGFPLAFSLLFGKSNTSILYLLGEVAELFAVTISIFFARRFLDRRSLTSLGLKLEWRFVLDLFVGIAITFVMMGAIYLVMFLAGWVRFEGFAWQSEPPLTVLTGTATALLTLLLVGWNEELLSRGYHLQTLASGSNLFWGVLLSSAIFGALHLMNPNATWISAGGVLLAGLFLALGYLRTGQLWLSIGLHIGWNSFEGVLFGFPVSGLEIYRLLHIQVSGPQAWTGGAFGPEAGLIVIPALLLGSLLVWLYTRKRDRCKIE
jgi:hypothetical protein